MLDCSVDQVDVLYPTPPCLLFLLGLDLLVLLDGLDVLVALQGADRVFWEINAAEMTWC
jgi:hypothetical protein